MIAIITSNLVIGIAVGAVAKWLWDKEQAHPSQYWGLLYGAVKAAEKAIPDDAPNKGAQKLDYALRTFVDKYEAASGKKVETAAEYAEIENLLECAVDQIFGKKQGVQKCLN